MHKHYEKEIKHSVAICSCGHWNPVHSDCDPWRLYIYGINSWFPPIPHKTILFTIIGSFITYWDDLTSVL